MRSPAESSKINLTQNLWMKYVFAFVLLLMPFTNVAQDSQENNDGTTWANLSRLSKATFVAGYRSGYASGFMSSMVLVQQGNKAVTDEDLLKLAHLAYRGGSSSNGDVVRQIDLIYSDYKNTPVCIAHVIFDAAVSLEGISVESKLEDERKKDAGNCHTN